MAITTKNGPRLNFRDTTQRRRSGWGWRLLNVALGLAALWLAGLLGFVAAIPGPTPRADAEQRTDAIIVLTGGTDRLAEGFRLLEHGLAKRLLISGVAPGVTLEQLVGRLDDPRAAPAAETLACCVTLGYLAENTAGNAEESAQWLEKNGATSVRLVTANYHMLRSLLEFRRSVPGVAVVANPVFPAEVRDAHWFLKPHTLLLIANEYDKYLLALARASADDVRLWQSWVSSWWPASKG
ncbi:MAG TPA: YdcF family protein [Candidatus Cybelea sp.]|nr:YdcF family protein [Candidatus Cybelea sp.]